MSHLFKNSTFENFVEEMRSRSHLYFGDCKRATLTNVWSLLNGDKKKHDFFSYFLKLKFLKQSEEIADQAVHLDKYSKIASARTTFTKIFMRLFTIANLEMPLEISLKIYFLG